MTEPSNTNEDPLRRLLAESIGPAALSNAEIEQLSATEASAVLSEERAARILSNVDDLLHKRAASFRMTSFAAENRTSSPPKFSARHHSERSEMKLIRSEYRRSSRRNHRGAVAAVIVTSLSLMAAMLGMFQEGRRHNEREEKRIAVAQDLLGRIRAEWRTAAAVSAPAADSVAVGDFLTTSATQRRRFHLPDGSVMFMNARSSARVKTARQVEVSQGEVFVEVVPQFDETLQREPFEIVTPDRTVTALGTKFAVNTLGSETDVVVTQGKVKVSGMEDIVHSGQELVLTENSGAVHPAERASERLDWTRDLVSAAAGALVPASRYAGGAIIAVDPGGQETKLSLRKYHVDVHVEDGFARTTIDQTYFNHTSERLEGTFHFPLPPDASLSRLAMYVNGRLMEGGMAEREHARNTFEKIVATMKDPALLEWIDGSTFRMRVFPLEARQEKRIVLSYTQRLNHAYGNTHYRFPAGHSMDLVRDWSAQVRVVDGSGMNWESPSHGFQAVKEQSDLILKSTETNSTMDRDIVVRFRDKATADSAAPKTRWSRVVHDGQQYIMLRHRPDLPGKMQREPRHWVFLFESSADRDPLLARTQIEVIRTLLDNAEHDDTFNIVTANTRPIVLSKSPLKCTAANIDKVVAVLEQTHLIGALNLQKALEACGPLCTSDRESVLLHVGSGIPVLGEQDQDALLKLVSKSASYVGVGVGRRWAQSFMREAASQTGGYFTQINPDEEIKWRAFELSSVLNAPRLLNVTVTPKDRHESPGSAEFLNFADTIVHGEEICAVMRLKASDSLPESVVISGVLNNQRWRRVVRLRRVHGAADYLPRTWAKLQIDRLVANGATEHREEIIQLSKAMYVMSPFTSLLVLENEAMYTQYNVDRGRKDHWALYPCPDEIKVVHEPLQQNRSVNSSHEASPGSVEAVLDTIRSLPQPQVALRPDTWPYGLSNLSAYAVQDEWYGAPRIPMSGRNRRYDYGFASDDLFFDQSQREYFIHDQVRNLREAMDSRAGRDGNRSNRGAMLHEKEIRLLETWNAPVAGIQGNNRYLGLSLPWTNLQSADTPFIAGLQPVAPGTSVESLMAPSGGMPPPQNLEYSMGSSDGTERFFFNSRWGQERSSDHSSLNPVQLGFGAPASSAHRMYFDTEFSRLSQLMGVKEFASENFSRHLQSASEPQRIASGLGRFRLGAQQASNLTDGFWINSPRIFGLSEELDFQLLRESELSDLTIRQQTRLMEQIETQDLRQIQRSLGSGDRWAQPQTAGNRSLVRLPLFGESILPQFGRSAEFFCDLMSHAPGLQTSRADVLAVLESELPMFGNSGAADTDKSSNRQQTGTDQVHGKVDSRALDLIQQARAVGWETMTLAGRNSDEAVTVHFDGTGQYTWKRKVSEGLDEHVVCNGAEVLHVYSEIGLAARRTNSRFHRRTIESLVPWLVPSADELSRGADVVAIADHTVAVIPLRRKRTLEQAEQQESDADVPDEAVVVHLVFGNDGKLAERRLVGSSGQVLLSVTYAADGTVTVTDTHGKVVNTFQLPRATTDAPDLMPALDDILVLPMPIRSAKKIFSSGNEDPEETNYDDWSNDELLGLILADIAEGNGTRAVKTIGERFLDEGDERDGLFVLLSRFPALLNPDQEVSETAGRRHSIDRRPSADASVLQQFLRQWITLQLDSSLDTEFDIAGPQTGFVQRMAGAWNVYHRWHSGAVLTDRTRAQIHRDLQDALDFVASSRTDVMGWTLLSVIQPKLTEASMFDAFAQCAKRFEDSPQLAHVVQHERSRTLLQAGKMKKGRTLYSRLFRSVLQRGLVPPIDAELRELFRSRNGRRAWSELMDREGQKLVKAGMLQTALLLSIQLRQLGDVAEANVLLDRVLVATKEAQRPDVVLLAVEQLRQLQDGRASSLMDRLVSVPQMAEWAELWWYASEVADSLGKKKLALVRMERAVQLEYAQRPDRINLEQLRSDYSDLLSRYEQMINAAAVLEIREPQNLAARIVRAADQWRSLDRDSTQCCQQTARILNKLRLRDQAWDFLTTPLSLHPGESAPWRQLAENLTSQKQTDLADMAWSRAFEFEKTNPEILLKHAQMLRAHGRPSESRRLLQSIVEGTWQPRFSRTVTTARQLLVSGP